jgi:hypothetical protein
VSFAAVGPVALAPSGACSAAWRGSGCVWKLCGIRDQGNQDLTLTNMVLSNNTATADGGGVSMENDTTNSQWTLTINASTITGNQTADAGGGVETDGSGNVVINTGTVISGNTSVYGGGGVFLDDVGNARDSANLSMTGVLVSDNSAIDSTDGFGGGISNAGNGAVALTNCTVESNFAAVSGGGFSDEYSVVDTGSGLGTLSVVNSNFVNNLAGSPDNSDSGFGGGIFASGTSMTITNSGFQNNTSRISGGAICDAGVNTLTIAGSTFANNTAIGRGGGIELLMAGTGATAAINNSTLTGNTAGTEGGGIDAPTSVPVLSRPQTSLLDANAALTLVNDTINGNFSYVGGGIFWGGADGSVTVQNTIIAQNTAFTAGPDAGNTSPGALPFTDGGGNLIGIAGTGSGNTGFTAPTTQTGTVAAPLNPRLASLANNGGPTIGATGSTQTLTTEALLPGSPALDMDVSAGAPTTDERGFSRPDTGAGRLPDVGAFEFQNAILAVSVTPPATPVVQGNSASFVVTVTNTGVNALPADNSIATVTLSPGLSATSPLTFPVGPLAVGQKISFTVTGSATAVGTQTATAIVTSADTSSSATGTGSVTVIPTAPPSPPPPPSPPAPPMAASIQFVTVTVVPNLFALNETETIDVHISSPGVVKQGMVTFTVDGHTVRANVDGSGDATASLTLPLSTMASPQSISTVVSGANLSPADAAEMVLWTPYNALLPTRATFAADGSQSVQSYLGGLPLWDFLYTPSGQLSEVVFGPNWLSWDFLYLDAVTVVRLNGALPVMVF